MAKINWQKVYEKNKAVAEEKGLRCPLCNRKIGVVPAKELGEDYDYPYECTHCDENFYTFECVEHVGDKNPIQRAIAETEKRKSA